MRGSAYSASIALVIVCVTSMMRAREVSSSAHVLTPSEIKELQGASTPEDHLNISTYLRQEAVQEDEADSLHDAIAAMPQTGSLLSRAP